MGKGVVRTQDQTLNPIASNGEGPSTKRPPNMMGSFLEISEIKQDARRRLLEAAYKRGLKPKQLGVSYSYLYKMRRGERPIPDSVLRKVLEFLDSDTILSVAPEIAPSLGVLDIDSLTVDNLVRFLVEWARRHPASAKVLVDTLEGELERLGLAGKQIRVTSRHLEEWEKLLDQLVADGEITRKTAKDYDREFRRALESTNYLLGPSIARAYIRGLERESRKRAVYASVALRLFASEILGDFELRAAIPSVSYRSRRRRAPSWEEFCRLLGSLDWPPARAYLMLLLSTGSRPGFLRELPVERLDLAGRVVWFYKPEEWYALEGTTKRQYVGFFTERVRDYLVEVYLPWRSVYVEGPGRGSRKLFPVKRRRLYQYIYEKSLEVLGYRIDLYTARHRFITHTLTRMPKQSQEFLVGHISPSVALSYYAQIDALEDLRKLYDEAMSRVPCL